MQPFRYLSRLVQLPVLRRFARSRTAQWSHSYHGFEVVVAVEAESIFKARYSILRHRDEGTFDIVATDRLPGPYRNEAEARTAALRAAEWRICGNTSRGQDMRSRWCCPCALVDDAHASSNRGDTRRRAGIAQRQSSSRPGCRRRFDPC